MVKAGYNALKQRSRVNIAIIKDLQNVRTLYILHPCNFDKVVQLGLEKKKKRQSAPSLTTTNLGAQRS